MSEKPPNEENLASALHRLGENLVQALQAAWESPERKKLQQEIEEGLNDITQTVERQVEDFKQSPTGQQLKADIDDLRERVRRGEAESQLRQELLKALQTVNAELEKAAARLRNVASADTPTNESDDKD